MSSPSPLGLHFPVSPSSGGGVIHTERVSKCAGHKRHTRGEDFATEDHREPQLGSPCQIFPLTGFHPAEGLQWLSSVAAPPGQITADPGI